MTYRCHVCGCSFPDRRPQDPTRDRGFGTCSACRAWWRATPRAHERRLADTSFAEGAAWCDVVPEAYG